MKVVLFPLFLILLVSSTLLSPHLFSVYTNVKNTLNSFFEEPSSGNVLINAIYQFGDSISDTGNNIRDPTRGSNCGSKPYGQSFFQTPTGRCSDGLLIVDFIAQALKIPLVEPYLEKNGDFRHGANFAMGGSTALNVSALASEHIFITSTNNSLLVQLGWFKSHLDTICASDSPLECKQKLGNALFIVGEIGGNDYTMGGEQGATMELLRALVPQVIKTIVILVKELIDLGAKRILMPGNYAAGCLPIILAEFKVNDTSKYDEHNCLTSWNELAMLHNDQLQNAIRDLQMENHDVAIVYGDYYKPFTSIFKHARSLGFEEDAVHKACCGSNDNEYNCNTSKFCGSVNVSVCQNPDKRVSWDGVHLTQHAYRLIADSLLQYSLPLL